MSARNPFIGFLVLAVGVVVGLVVLPPLTAASWTTTLNVPALPTTLQVVWLAWLAAWWGMLVTIILTVGAWMLPELSRSEEEMRSQGDPARASEGHVVDIQPTALSHVA